MMLKLKKIILYLIVLSMFMAVVPDVYADNMKTIQFNNEIKVLNALDIMDEISYPEQLISRGEMASLITRLCGMSKNELSEPNQLFYDVPVTNPYFLEISYCARMSYMSGYGEGIFNPDYKIRSEEAVATLVKFLGYSYLAKSRGDGFVGYIAAAKELGITNGLSLPYGECIYKEEVAKLIYNSLFIPLLSVSSISDDGRDYKIDALKTPLSEYHKMAKAKGIVTATEITGIKGYSKAAENTFVLDGYAFKTDNKLIRKYLGYEIELIYSIDEVTKYECLIFYPVSDMNKVEVKLSNFISITQAGFNYENEFHETKKLNISPSFDFIYNGKLTLYDERIIEKSTYGYFELISTADNYIYDVVVFNEYKTLVVDSVVPSREIIQGSSIVQGDGNLILDYDSSKYDICITDMEDNVVDISSLKKYDVITYYVNGKYISGYVTSKTAEGIITSKTDSECEIFLDEDSYSMSGDKKSFYPTFKINDTVILYIDFMGNVAGATITSDATGENLYIPLKLGQTTVAMEKKVLLKVYDVNEATIKVFYLNDKITLDGDMIADSYSAYARINSALFSGTTGTPAMIKLNSDGLVRDIDTPCTPTSFNEGEDGFTTMIDSNSVYYDKSKQNYGNKAYGDENTKHLLIPDNLSNADSDDFVLTSKPSTTTTRTVSAYTDSKNNRYATLVLYKHNGYFTLSASASTAIITKISTVINEDGEECKKIYYITGDTENYCLSKNDNLQDSFVPKAGTNYYQDPIYVKDLQKGDIISVGVDNEKYLVAFRCLWKSDMKFIKSQYQYNYKYRFVEATVKSIDSEFLTLTTHVNRSSETYDDIEHYKLYTPNVYILSGNGTKNVTWKIASVADIVPGDKIVLQALSYSLSNVYIIK